MKYFFKKCIKLLSCIKYVLYVETTIRVKGLGGTIE